MNFTEIQQALQMQSVIQIIELTVMVSILIFIIFLILRLSSVFRKQDNELPMHEKAIEKRVAAYERIAAKLYDILSFYLYTGNWMEISPVDVLRLKRELEKDTKICTPLLSDEIVNKIQEFNQLCFISASGWEHDVKIKSLYKLREQHGVEWEESWVHYFDTNNVVEAIKMKQKYDELIESFKSQMMLA